MSAFASHLPVLRFIGQHFDVWSVLELGSGEFSTKCFLDREMFPKLEIFLSLDDDANWAKKIRKEHGNDARFNQKVITSDAEFTGTLYKEIPARKDDVIFVDYSMNAETVCKLAVKGQIIVIHDFEYKPYREAVNRAKGIVHVMEFESPWVSQSQEGQSKTGLVWKS